jgi:hypothetical protein
MKQYANAKLVQVQVVLVDVQRKRRKKLVSADQIAVAVLRVLAQNNNLICMVHVG